nr:hypothetical protein [Paenibacillus sp. PL91]MBC9198727.1 hypothetical protein [Paenibacillus sp. PL91]
MGLVWQLNHMNQVCIMIGYAEEKEILGPINLNQVLFRSLNSHGRTQLLQ